MKLKVFDGVNKDIALGLTSDGSTFRTTAINAKFADEDSPSIDSTITFTNCIMEEYYDFMVYFITKGAELTTTFDSCDWTNLDVTTFIRTQGPLNTNLESMDISDDEYFDTPHMNKYDFTDFENTLVIDRLDSKRLRGLPSSMDVHNTKK